MTESTAKSPTPVTSTLLDEWATDPSGPVALHLRQKLLPVERNDGEDAVIYPPTYADIGYCIDTLSDGTRVALVDSVGSQANRMEPLFKSKFKADGDEEWLVPQIEVLLREEPCGKCEACTSGKKKAKCDSPHQEKRSLLDLAHRSADAVVMSSPTLAKLLQPAFETLRSKGDAAPLCTLAPTSLVFGVWDSRGGTGEKRPRLVRAVIRAWDVEPLHAAAQFNSVWKALDEEQKKDLTDAAKKKGKDWEKRLSGAGLKDAPATFRRVSTSASKYMHEFRDGSPNPERRVLGGVLVKDRIEREITVNLVALRGLRGSNDSDTTKIRKYLLGLSLVAATAELDLFLREGCHLRYANEDAWHSVPRRGEPEPVNLGSAEARELVLSYAMDAAKHFRPKWEERLGESLVHNFDLNEAKKLLAKKDEESPEGE